MVTLCEPFVRQTHHPQENVKEERNEVLPLVLHSHSSHVKDFHPKNILLNRPQDQSSRWSASVKEGKEQYVILRISLPLPLAIIEEIAFGKYHLPHVCTLKEFKVFISIDGEEWLLALHGSLRNDGNPEQFPLRHQLEPGVVMPAQFIKIMPIATWGHGFNFGIWYVEAYGRCNKETISRVLSHYSNHRSLSTSKPSKKTNELIKIIMETPTDKQLDLPRIDALIQQELGNRNKEANATTSSAVWKQICASPETQWPAARGGHQLVADGSIALFLFGGWDGKREFGDFWRFDIATSKWKMLSANVAKEGGPTPRSVHRMAVGDGKIFCLGYYSESTEDETKPDFYCYEIATNRWELLSTDTKTEGGPGCIYDHQMAYDPKTQKLWVVGGRPVSKDKCDPMVFSGLFSYHIKRREWQEHVPEYSTLRRASFHLLHHNRTLILLRGRRHQREELTDAIVFDLDRECIVDMANFNLAISHNSLARKLLVDTPTFAIKGVMAAETSEIVVIGERGDEVISHRFGQEHLLGTQETTGWGCWKRLALSDEQELPAPRYASSLTAAGCGNFWIFGGISAFGDDENSEKKGAQINEGERISDLWNLSLVTKSPETVVAEAKALVRRCSFIERLATLQGNGGQTLACKTKAEALDYLRGLMAPFLSESLDYTSTLGEIITTLPERLFFQTAEESKTAISVEDASLLIQEQDPAAFQTLRTIVTERRALIRRLQTLINQ